MIIIILSNQSGKSVLLPLLDCFPNKIDHQADVHNHHIVLTTIMGSCKKLWLMLVADDDGEGEDNDCDYVDVDNNDWVDDHPHHHHRFMQKALANVGGCPERRWVGLEPSVRPNCKPMRIIIMMMMLVIMRIMLMIMITANQEESSLWRWWWWWGQNTPSLPLQVVIQSELSDWWSSMLTSTSEDTEWHCVVFQLFPNSILRLTNLEPTWICVKPQRVG